MVVEVGFWGIDMRLALLEPVRELGCNGVRYGEVMPPGRPPLFRFRGDM
jgi:hypothetical protein